MIDPFEIRVSKKQKQALSCLKQDKITEVLYGGGAGGGKSWLLCLWNLLNCLEYPGCRILLGRTVLKNLKNSTLLTQFDVFRKYGLVKDIDYSYNQIDGILTIKKTNSQIYLKDLELYPSDPEFDSLGSTEFTFAGIDEAQQLSLKAKSIVKTRLRYMTKEFNIRGKLLMTCNPGKNFLRNEFYTPFKKNELPPFRAFIPSLVTDNPYIDQNYIEELHNAPEDVKQRLLYGNWDYEDDPNQLIPYQWIENALVNPSDIEDKGDIKRVGFDVAREGNDKSVIGLRVGDYFKDLKHIQIPIKANLDISGANADALISYCRSEGVGYENTYVDAIGNGGGVVDACRARAFPVREYKGSDSINEDTQKATGKFRNQRAYSYWALRQDLQSGRLKINKNLKNLDELIEELTNIHYESEDKITIESKDDIKLRIGRSTDFSDALAMTYVKPLVKNNTKIMGHNRIMRR